MIFVNNVIIAIVNFKDKSQWPQFSNFCKQENKYFQIQYEKIKFDIVNNVCSDIFTHNIPIQFLLKE